MAKHAPRSGWMDLFGKRWAGRLRIIGPIGVLLVLVAGGVSWAIVARPDPVSLELGPPPTIVLSPPATSAPQDHAGSRPTPANAPIGIPAGQPTAAPATTRATPGPGPATSRSGTTSRRPPQVATPTPSKPVATPATAPTTDTRLSVRMVPGVDWTEGFVGGFIVRNRSMSPLRFQVRVNYPEGAQVRITNAWNATVTASSSGGSSVFTFVGGPVNPGVEATVGFEGRKPGGGAAKATSCTVTVING